MLYYLAAKLWTKAHTIVGQGEVPRSAEIDSVSSLVYYNIGTLQDLFSLLNKNRGIFH